MKLPSAIVVVARMLTAGFGRASILAWSVIAASLLLLPAHAQSQGANGIIWYYSDFPPVAIVGGVHKGTGYMDRTQEFLAARLPGYQHRFVQANTQRKLEGLKNQQQACTEMLKTADREAYVEYSLPVQIILPNGVVVARRKLERFNPHMAARDRLSLRQALQNPALRLGVSLGRSYSEEIDQVLKAHGDKPNVLTRAGPDLTRGLMQMLINDRLDYVLMFPIEMKFLQEEMGITEELVFLPVLETTDYQVDHIGCPKNPWGRKLISEINALLVQSNKTEIPSFYSRWLDPNSRALHAHYLKSFHGTP